MTLYDISLIYSEDLPTWPGKPKVQLKKISSIQDGESANETSLFMYVHAGTHVDAPDHFLGDGQTVEKIPLDFMIGPAVVVGIKTKETITADDLKEAGIPSDSTRILLKTRNSEYWSSGNREFQEDFIGLSADAASYLVDLGIQVVGVDYLSVAPFGDPVPTHKILLEAGVLIIEGLDMSQVESGEYTLLCLPLKIKDSDGAPARVLLMR
jgi:arylformamidase